MLEQGRYTWRHNSVLQELYLSFGDLKCDNWEVIVDLPNHSSIQGNTTVPCDIVQTTQRPDLVLINREKCEILLVELTVCFESQILHAHERKTDRYASLLTDIRDKDFNAKLFTIEVGSRGYVDVSNFNKLKCLAKNLNPKVKQLDKTIKRLRNDISKCAVLCSFSLFYSKYNAIWKDPPLLRR